MVARATRPGSADGHHLHAGAAVRPMLGDGRAVPNVFCSIGTHPHHAHEEADVTGGELVDLPQHPKVVAIGEAGLDYHYDNSPREAQAAGFRRTYRGSAYYGAAARDPCARG